MTVLSFFHDKMAAAFSMLRLIAFLFAIACTINISPGMGWPFAFVCCCTLFSIPFSKLFEGPLGALLLGKLLDRFGIGETGFATKGGAVQIVDALKHHFDAGA